MNDRYDAMVGIDWASSAHQACVIDATGRELGNRRFPHSGSGLAALADWIAALTGSDPIRVAAAIETPHGPVVESLQERGFTACSINPRQMDRFRDRRFPAGQKDDRRDAWVLADALRTDPQAFRVLEQPGPLTLELREHSRLHAELVRERVRLGHRLRAQLWCYYPQLLDLTDDVTEAWVMDLWESAPTPEQARRISRARIARLLKDNRIRRINAEQVKTVLAKEALNVAPGTARAAAASITLLIERLRLIRRQLEDVNGRIDQLTAEFDEGGREGSPDGGGQRDADILRSIPGVGRMVLATLLTEAHDPLRRRDHRALRALCGVAPVTKRSGKSIIVVRRRAACTSLVNAVHHWARTAIQHDPKSRQKYDALRERGCRHSRALRSVGDRLLAVACAMLRDRTLYRPDHAYLTQM